jgi:hypothetical protein
MDLGKRVVLEDETDVGMFEDHGLEGLVEFAAVGSLNSTTVILALAGPKDGFKLAPEATAYTTIVCPGLVMV